MEYRIRREDGDVVVCDSCGCEAPTGEFDWGPPFTEKHNRPHRMLCKFCATTMASRHTKHPERDEYAALRSEIWKAAACVFNMLKTPNV